MTMPKLTPIGSGVDIRFEVGLVEDAFAMGVVAKANRRVSLILDGFITGMDMTRDENYPGTHAYLTFKTFKTTTAGSICEVLEENERLREESEAARELSFELSHKVADLKKALYHVAVERNNAQEHVTALKRELNETKQAFADARKDWIVEQSMEKCECPAPNRFKEGDKVWVGRCWDGSTTQGKGDPGIVLKAQSDGHAYHCYLPCNKSEVVFGGYWICARS